MMFSQKLCQAGHITKYYVQSFYLYFNHIVRCVLDRDICPLQFTLYTNLTVSSMPAFCSGVNLQLRMAVSLAKRIQRKKDNTCTMYMYCKKFQHLCSYFMCMENITFLVWQFNQILQLEMNSS